MAVTDAPRTLSELRTDFLNRVRAATGVTATNNIADRFLNIALQDMHIHRQWWWAERRAEIVTRDDYSTGTIAVTEGGTAVTGTSTAWTTENAFGVNNARVDDKTTLGAATDVYRISAVGGATSFTLASRYTGSTIASGGAYRVFQDEYALASDFNSPLDVRVFSEERKIWLLGPKEFYRRYSRNSVLGVPRYATLIELGPSGSTDLRRRVVFGPTPDNEYTIPYRYITTNLAMNSSGTAQAQLTATTDEPIMPLRYRQAIVYKALQHWYRDRKDDQRAGEASSEYENFILRIGNDMPMDAADRLRFVPWLEPVSSYRPRGSRRFSTDDAWDQLRW